MEEENKNIEEPVIEPQPVVQETPVEPAPITSEPVTVAPAELPKIEEPAPEEPKKKSKLPIILLLLILLAAGGFAVWYFVLGGNGSKKESGKEETSQKEEKKDDKKEEKKEEESVLISELSEEEANSFVNKYKINYEGLADDNHPHCGALANIFKKGGSSIDDFSEWEHQIVIMSNLKLDNKDKNEFSFTEYAEEGKKLFGTKYEAKIVKNEGNIYSGVVAYYKYDESAKTLSIKETDGGGICSPYSYKVKFVSGKKYSDKIELEYKAYFSADYEDVMEYSSINDFEKANKYVVTFIKDGDNYIFSKAE